MAINVLRYIFYAAYTSQNIVSFLDTGGISFCAIHDCEWYFKVISSRTFLFSWGKLNWKKWFINVIFILLSNFCDVRE